MVSDCSMSGFRISLERQRGAPVYRPIVAQILCARPPES
jgi:hypothetical protein